MPRITITVDGDLAGALDARACLEVAARERPVGESRRITAERGVRYGQRRLLLLAETAGDR